MIADVSKPSVRSWILLLALTGCPRAADTTSSSSPDANEGSDQSGEAAVEASSPGVYFAVDDRVVWLSEAGEFSLIASPDGQVRQLLVGPERRLSLVGDTGIWVLEQGRFVPWLEFDSGLGRVEQVAIGEGEVWAIGSAAIGVAHKAEWRFAGKLEREVVDFASGARGALFGLVDEHVLRFEGPDAWIDVGVALPFAHASELAIADSGRVAIAGATCELAVVDANEPGAAWARGRESGYGCEYPSALAIDGRGRVWVGSTTGVHVVESSGAVQPYPTGSLPELVGSLRSIAVIGEGPRELPSAGPIRSGGFAGTLEFRGKPLAKAKVEICPRPAPLFHSTPCDNSKLRFTTTTAADGRFRFDAVPLARYGWALQIGEQWTSTEADAVVGTMQADQVLDIGVQRLE